MNIQLIIGAITLIIGGIVCLLWPDHVIRINSRFLAIFKFDQIMPKPSVRWCRICGIAAILFGLAFLIFGIYFPTIKK
jgi:uncharacterized membrane protein HdeD (DUF308 family)